MRTENRYWGRRVLSEMNSDAGAAPSISNECNVELVADVASSFTYASIQNAIPILRAISIRHGTGEMLENVSITLSSNPAFLRPKVWKIDRLAPGDEIALSDRRLELDADYLAGLNEAERGEITLTLSVDGREIERQHHSVRLLARDEWGGVADMAQLLPAFSLPNDPGVARVLLGAADRLAEKGHSSGLDGYQSGDPRRAYLLAAAIYSAIADMSIHYAEPPASFEERGQKIRRPETIASERLATCLDTTLLFAAALEGAGLNPVILMFHGHAAVGVWLSRRTFGNTVETDQMEVRKALSSNELVIFETTGVTHRPAMTLEAAQRALDQRMSENEAGDFVAAIDIRRARSGGITPLASHSASLEREAEVGSDGRGTGLPLPEAPSFGDMPDLVFEEKPTSAAGRIDRWQRKLLDLTLRNRLLNFPATKKTIPFVCTDVALLEDRLADGAAIRIVSLPQQNPLGERDEALYREVHGEDLQRSFASQALRRDELPSPLDPQQLQARLIDLHRQVRNDFAEGGANTLFLAVGFLRWKKKPEDERSYRAPLLLIPVKLERKSASAPFRLRFHEDDPRFNATLLQFLERDFDLRLPQFNGELPGDESGVDVPRVLAMMRQAVREVPGMEVVDETALSTFSFAKFLMWKDLVERTDALRENRVVRHLIDTPEQAFGGADGTPTFVDESQLDAAYDPAQIVSLLPSDSSQTAASLAAAEGHDFVIVGPPGTGKSQTIANMIANCLANGRTVLFVAEKTAALDVVYRRLKENGLGDQCIELHSNKADRRQFLAQLKASWERGRTGGSEEWSLVNERLRIRRDSLNAYVGALHARHSNGWTPYLALGIASKEADAPAPQFDWPADRTHDASTLEDLEELAAELGLVFGSVRRRPSLDLIDIEELTFERQEEVLGAAVSLRNATDLLVGAIKAYAASLDFRQVTQVPLTGALARLARCIEAGRDRDLSIAFDADFEKTEGQLNELTRTIGAYREAERQTCATFPLEAVRELDVASLDREWRDADASMWPFSVLAKRKTRRHLQSYAIAGEASPDSDLPRLREMQAQLASVDATPLAARALPIAGLETDTEAVRDILDKAADLRGAIRAVGVDDTGLEAVARQVAAGTADGEKSPLWTGGAKLLAAREGFETARERFEVAAGRKIGTVEEVNALVGLSERLTELAASRHLLRDWSTWCRVRNRATGSGLGPLVLRLENGEIEANRARDAFRLGYARWWLPPVLDRDPVLREFRRFQHENDLHEFREIDDLVRSHAAGRVREAIAHGLPAVQSVPRNSELGLLRHQMELQRPSQSIRDMIGKMPESFSKLAPCMLMSPLSIAQYFPPDQALFDVVIFDEASQITTWDAVGAIARARQTIIVGDPRQLPPTNFFGSNDDDEEVAEHEKDMESILDEAKASGIPLRDLRWHYRSRSESLIAFSNSHYYQNRLVTFPSPQVDDRAVRLRKVPNGVYDRGKSRTNRIEAQAVADEAVARMRAWIELPEEKRPTLAVITFNAQQQSLILDLLDAARREEPDLEWFFADERVEPTIVKNLENVQGDERDVILFSITFWKDAGGKLTMDFGALNRDGGERRLNVAVTRARQELVVFSGFTSDMIDPSRSKGLAIHHLKTFLDYAERGAIALPAADMGSQGGYESPFEEAVAAQLENRGWLVVPQVGISGFRIDLGIRHPDRAGAYLAGIECDGASYHSAATARDRDKVREQVLTGLGWKMLRVWSTDWWHDPKGCADRLHADLNGLLEADVSSAREAAASVRLVTEPETGGVESPEAHDVTVDARQSADARIENPDETAPVLADGAVDAEAYDQDPAQPPETVREGSVRTYRIADLEDFVADPARFFEFGYRDTLRAMVEAVMDAESPLRTDILAQRIARAHGWLRTGAKIRERIEIHLREYDRTHETSGEFIWKAGSVVDNHPFRHPHDEESRRAIAEIPLAELIAIVRANPGLADEADPARKFARLLGVERLAAGTRTRLDEALARGLHPETHSPSPSFDEGAS